MADPTTRFSNRVENYVKFRPGYPDEIVQHLSRKIDLTPASVIADIGSGTGISSKIFLENRNTVYGVEPNAAMRSAAETYLSAYDNFIGIDGAAENTTLDKQSVDIITAFQAFHWFDNPAAKLEFKRILRKGGFLCLVWNERKLDSNEFLRDYERFLVEYGTDYEKVRHDQITKDSIEASFEKPFSVFTLSNEQILDFEGLKGRLLSSSYIPSETDAKFDEMLKNLFTLFSRFEEKGRIRIQYDTNVFYGMI
ncbi:MAG: class I SAM-dependent methyltransferase [Acidobacteria bacterium]|nr:class I SAM-dependent methyltransferase [Acidobacteriota bacterium]